MSEKHFHTCIMHKRIATCRVKYEVKDCENLEINNECLVSDSLPLGLCDNFECNITDRLDHYELKFEEYAQKDIEQKRMIDHFRSILLMPNDYQMGNSINFTGIDSYIMRQYPTWEATDPDKIIYFIAMHKRVADLASEWIQKKIGVINLPEHADKKKKLENKKAQEALAKAKAEEKAQEVKTYTPKTPYEKELAKFIKLMTNDGKIPVTPEIQENAKKTLELMGLKP